MRGPQGGPSWARLAWARLAWARTAWDRMAATASAWRWPAWAAANLALLLVAVGGVLLVGALTALSAEVYESVDEGEGVAALDRPALDLARNLRTPAAVRAVSLLTDVGGERVLPVLATLAAVVMALAWRRWTPLLVMAVAGGGSVLLTVVGKAVVGRTRPPAYAAVPPLETSASFPSGHALNIVVVAGVVAYLLLRRQRTVWARSLTVVAAVLVAVAIGLSRVFLGHHWLTDVLVAWTLGLAWLGVVVTAHQVSVRVRSSRARSGWPAAQ